MPLYILIIEWSNHRLLPDSIAEVEMYAISASDRNAAYRAIVDRVRSDLHDEQDRHKVENALEQLTDAVDRDELHEYPDGEVAYESLGADFCEY